MSPSTTLAHGALTHQIIGAAMTVHRTLGRGYLEAVYQRALQIELLERELSFDAQREFRLNFKGHDIDVYRLDLIVADCVVVEIKAISALTPSDDAQLINYLRCANADAGLLINFGAPSLEYRRRVLHAYIP